MDKNEDVQEAQSRMLLSRNVSQEWPFRHDKDVNADRS
ncbi:hypothetical protein PTD2_08479 [Pseudoalteromonas tunicata D2]|uniref:Uncharacterized protein n=1 Tax=Pseudoalteromonas tunicata D2 TaxID=87626 RepID=A4C901_9GAMM|nr:hypothetical protein PTD2_08479 [Pseudoalteromonas tunicata D2]